MTVNNIFRKKKFWIILSSVAILVAGFAFQKEGRNYLAEKAFEKGNGYFENKDNYNLEKAQKFYRTAIFFQNEYPKAHYQLGRIDFLGGNFPVAIAEFKKELEYNSSFSKSYYMLGLTYGYAGKFEEAEKSFNNFIERNPQTWAAYNDLAWVYLLDDKYDKAKETCEKGLENDPGNPWLHSNLGNALMNLDKFTEAEQEFLTAYLYAKDLTAEDWDKVYPGNSPQISKSGILDFKAGIVLNIAIVNKRMGNNEKAEQVYKEYLAILPEDDSRRIPFEYFMQAK